MTKPIDLEPAGLFYRPFEYDDWGMIRNADGSMFASVRRPLSEEEAAAHRAAKTDPFEDLAHRLIASFETASRSAPEAGKAVVKRLPIPDGVSMTGGLICLGYEDNDERDLAYDALEAYGAGDISALASPAPSGAAVVAKAADIAVVDPAPLHQLAEEQLCTCGAAGSGEGHTDWCDWQSSEWRKWGDAFDAVASPQGVAPAEEIAGRTHRDDNETYEIGKRDGYEDAIQDLDLATGGDGEFRGSTIPGETVDVPAMKRRIIERFTASEAEASDLRRKLEETEFARDEWKASHGRVVAGFAEVCEAFGVQFDAPEAVTDAIRTKISSPPSPSEIRAALSAYYGGATGGSATDRARFEDDMAKAVAAAFELRARALTTDGGPNG